MVKEHLFETQMTRYTNRKKNLVWIYDKPLKKPSLF